MSEENANQQETSGEETSEQETSEQKKSDETPELSEEGKEKVKQMQAAYDDSRETAVLPGTDKTITGVAINEWLDDEGNPKFGKDEQKQRENDAEQHQEQHDDEQKQHQNEKEDA